MSFMTLSCRIPGLTGAGQNIIGKAFAIIRNNDLQILLAVIC